MQIRILIALACLGLLYVAVPAGAAAVEPGLAEQPIIELEDVAEEELEEEVEVCEEVEEGLEECEEAEAEGRAAGAQRPQECLLRSANARVVAYAEKNQVKLTVGYTTYESADVTIAFRSGSLQFGSVRRHLGRSGVIRLTKRLSDSQTAKLDAGDHASVQLRVVGAPASCKRVGQLSPRLVLLSR